jgi:hypothetical protein
MKLFESQFESDLLAGSRNEKKSEDEIIGCLAGIDLDFRYIDNSNLVKNTIQVPILHGSSAARPIFTLISHRLERRNPADRDSLLLC